MTQNQKKGFLVFNIGLLLSTILIGRLAIKYDISILELIPVFISLLLMVGGLSLLSFFRDRKL